MRLSCYEEEFATLQPLTIDIRNKLPFLTYGHFQSFICSSFGQGFYLQEENEVEDNLRACGKLVAQNRDEHLKQEQVYGQKKADLGAKEVERNLWACAQLSFQILYNVLDTEENEEVYGQHEAYPSLKLF